jgi:S1-C subfamily serine protease
LFDFIRLKVIKSFCYQDLHLTHLTKQLVAYSANQSKEKHQRKEKHDERKDNHSNFKIAYFSPFFLLLPVVKAKEKDDREEIGLFGNDNLDQSTKLSRRRQFNFIADVVELVLPSIVQIEQKQHTLFGIAAVANGSGFIVDESGIILTNAHVVRDINADLIVKLNDGYTYKGRVVKIDKSADLAIVKIDCVGVIFI